MKRKIITTADGSKTIQIEEWNEQYHSIHGAINEANHVFITHGLLFFLDSTSAKSHQNDRQIDILEIGFGTGLNAFLTLLKSQEIDKCIDYVGVEAYPITQDEIKALNYTTLVSPKNETEFNHLHQVPWENYREITPKFRLKKEQKLFKDIDDVERFDIIYFDAFGARVQPELWTEAIFKRMFNALKSNGVLVTYSAKGSVRRAMQTSGFEVERLPGPPNKRHMLRAIKR